MSKRILRYSGLGLAVLTAGAIAACSSDNSGTPGSGGSSAGAKSGGAGGASAGTPGVAGANTAGANTAGASTGGASGAGTAGGGGGAGYVCGTGKPASALITEFADLVASTDPNNVGNYTFMAGIPGGTFTYQPGALTLATTGMALNIKGNVHAYDGFGVYFNSCTDASAYTGVSFNIKGKAGPKGTLSFRVQTNANTAISMQNMKGTCVVPAGTTDTYPLCHAAAFDIPVTVAGSVVSVTWSQLAGGVPVDGVTGGKDVVGLEWAFNWDPAAAAGGAAGTGAGGASAGSGGASAGSGGASAGSGGASAGSGGASAGSGGASAGSGGASGGTGGTVAGSYDADITIDDIKFTGGPPAGGAGGASAGGAGGASAGAGGASAGAGGSSAGAAGAKGGSGGTSGAP